MEEGDFDATQMEKRMAGELHNGAHIMMNGKPCKITGTTKAKPGKHGSAKAIIKGMNLLDGKTVEQSFGTGDMVDCPIIKRNEYQLLGVTDDEFLQLMTEDGEMKEDVRLPDKEGMHGDARKKIEEFLAAEKQVYVQITTILGNDYCTDAREDKD